MKTILIADDQEVIRHSLKKALELSGYNVLEAKNGKEAFEVLLMNKVDFCVIDLNMPYINGMELIQLMKFDYLLKDIPFMILSALDKKELYKEIANVGACWVQQKGTNLKEVASMVKSIDFLGC